MRHKAFHVLLVFIWSGAFMPVLAQTFNYDESLVGTYTLPDPLITQSGKKVCNSRVWKNTRRQEISNLFEENVYGKLPASTNAVHFKVTSIDPNALQGKATKK